MKEFVFSVHVHPWVAAVVQRPDELEGGDLPKVTRRDVSGWIRAPDQKSGQMKSRCANHYTTSAPPYVCYYR